MTHWHDTMVDRPENGWCGLRDGLDGQRFGSARDHRCGLDSRDLAREAPRAEHSP